MVGSVDKDIHKRKDMEGWLSGVISQSTPALASAPPL